MRYRRNSDERLRSLERQYKESKTVEDMMGYLRELARTGMLEQAVLNILAKYEGLITYDRINIFQSTADYQRKLEHYGDDPNYRVSNDFLAFEVKRDVLAENLSAEDYAKICDAIAEQCIEVLWPVIQENLYLFSGAGGYDRRRRVEYFLEEDFDFSHRIKSHKDIDKIFEMENLIRLYERPLDEYEEAEVEEHKQTLHRELDRAILKRKIYVVNPLLLQTTGEVSVRIPNGGALLADHMGRYETMLHIVLAELPASSYPESPRYVTWYYNMQSGGFGDGHRFKENEYTDAVEDYFKRILKIS